MQRSGKGLTIVELLVVVAVIAVLFGMLFPALNRARNAAESLTCQNNLRQLGLWGYQYTTRWNGVLPTNGSNVSSSSRYITLSKTLWAQKVPTWKSGYNKGGTILFCPTITKYMQPNAYTGWEATATYSLSRWMGGELVDTGPDTSYYSAPPERLRLTMLKAYRIWIADGHFHSTYPSAPGQYAFSDYVDMMDTSASGQPWPWQTGSKIRNVWHPNKTANFLFGDGHVESWLRKQWTSLPDVQKKRVLGAGSSNWR